MSKYFAMNQETYEVHDIIWRQFPKGHPYREHGWWRVFWGEKEIAWITRGRSRYWDVTMQINVPDMREIHHRGIGFATRWYATEYALKCAGIWKPLD